MLYFWSGKTLKFPMIKNYYMYSRTLLHLGHPEYLETEFAKRAVKEIDNTDLVSPYNAISPVLGSISTERLSGGVKTLIMLYSIRDMTTSGSLMGGNCYRLLFEISRDLDIYLRTTSIFGVITDMDMCGFCVNTGEYVNNSNQYKRLNALHSKDEFDYTNPLCKMWADRTLGGYLKKYSLEDVISGKCLLSEGE